MIPADGFGIRLFPTTIAAKKEFFIIIKPEIFDYLEEHINNSVRERGEFQLTSALERLRQTDGFQGLIIEGQRFDLGLSEYYLETLRV